MARASFHALDASRAVDHIVTELAAARRAGGRTTIPTRFTGADLALVRLMPAWVVRAALLKSRGAWWLWCEPRKGTRATRDTRSGQLVMDLPPGRYMVDLLDTDVHAWFSRESAAASPLVVGLPATGAPVLARIRRVSASTARPRE